MCSTGKNIKSTFMNAKKWNFQEVNWFIQGLQNADKILALVVVAMTKTDYWIETVSTFWCRMLKEYYDMIIEIKS